MTHIDTLIKKIEASDQEIFWLGKATLNEIEKLELLLEIHLSKSFKNFLLTFGGGGVIDSEISGIEDNNAELDYGGTVYGDTIRCRKDYDLPTGLVTIFFRDDEICWCLDTNKMNTKNECPVVSYNLFNKKIDSKISDDFNQFFEEYLELRASE